MNKTLKDLDFGLLHTKSFLADGSFGDSALIFLLSTAPHLQGTVTIPNSTGMGKGGVITPWPESEHVCWLGVQSNISTPTI